MNRENVLRDIHGPVPIAEQAPYLLIAGVVFLLLVIAALIYWYLKKKKLPATPPMPPWEKALLDLAEAKSLFKAERGIVYMDRASQILRTYIESRFAVQSTRQTTREFLHSLTGIGDNSPLQTYKTELKDCLEQADMAKFAHHLPQHDNLEQMETAVTNFVKKTVPQPSAEKKSKPLKSFKSLQSPKPAAPYKRGRS